MPLSENGRMKHSEKVRGGRNPATATIWYHFALNIRRTCRKVESAIRLQSVCWFTTAIHILLCMPSVVLNLCRTILLRTHPSMLLNLRFHADSNPNSLGDQITAQKPMAFDCRPRWTVVFRIVFNTRQQCRTWPLWTRSMCMIYR